LENEPYLIKKYANRRLYDAAQKKFVNLEELRQLIRAGHRVRVEDADGRDVTRQILLQVIAECEDEGQSMLSTETLHAVTRFYGDMMQSVFGRYLDESVRTFLRQQDAWRGAVQDAMTQGPMAAFERMARDQLDLWNAAQQQAMETFLPPRSPKAKRRKKGG
jgi:polyhydroxyalkanoate synthesis repressor PhaR